MERVSNSTSSTSRFVQILTAPTFPEKAAKAWIDDQFHLALMASAAYVVVVFGLRYLMRNRKPFDLFLPLNAWNLMLAIFSIAGTIKLTPEFFGTIQEKGLQNSYCQIYSFTAGTNGYWTWLFIVSKLVELVDTVFLVLRKRPLMFLHWYHHILTLIYAWYSYPLSPGFNRWGIYLNLFVHAFMYSYYFLRSMKIRVPGVVAQFITTLQILQFVISCAILAHLGFLIHIQKADCVCDPKVLLLASFMDTTYLMLFVNFFLKSYVLGGGKTKYRSTETKPLVNGNVVNDEKKEA